MAISLHDMAILEVAVSTQRIVIFKKYFNNN